MDEFPPFDKECFFIGPIGHDGSPERERSDGILDFVIAPAAEAVGLVTVRADRIARPGQITLQVIEHVLSARAAVADLTGANPNVYYEMAVRHTARLPTVLIAEDGEKLPFDIQQMRTIFLDHKSLKNAAECRSQITRHLKEALDGAVDSPIAAGITLQNLQLGNPQERALADVVNRLEGLSQDVRALRAQGETPGGRDRPDFSERAIRDLEDAYLHLRAVGRAQDDPELQALAQEFARPLSYFTHRARVRLPNRDLPFPEDAVAQSVPTDPDKTTEVESEQPSAPAETE